ncbi:hypothetical protein [Paenibacillus faecis]|uniref:hypothetical protein n=1 Tax=Paenibacillus faecis TaxID=862114 RepID=UPI001BD04923|nr:hypothetical protein [Paenibacillus faecis]
MNLQLQLWLRALKTKLTLFFIFFLVILGGYSIHRVEVDEVGDHNLVLNVLTGMMNENIVLFLYIPMFLVFILNFVFSLFKSNVLLKYGDFSKWWLNSVFLIFLFSATVSLIIQLVMVSMLLFGGLSLNDIVNIYLPIGILITCTLLSGFVLLGEASFIIVLCFRKHYWGIIVPIVLLFIIKTVQWVFKANWITLDQYMAISYKYSSNSTAFGQVNLSDAVHVGICFSATLILYVLGLVLIKEKDIYWE